MWEHFIAHELHKFKFEVEALPSSEFDSWILYFKQKRELEEKESKKAQQKATKKKSRRR